MRGSTIVRQLSQLLGGQTGKRVVYLERAGVLDLLHKRARRFRSQLGGFEAVSLVSSPLSRMTFVQKAFISSMSAMRGVSRILSRSAM